MSSSKMSLPALELLSQQMKRMRDKDVNTLTRALIYLTVSRRLGLTTAELA